MRFIDFFIKYHLIFILYLILTNYQSANAQESKVNKIIIDESNPIKDVMFDDCL